MGIYINTGNEGFQSARNSEYVDKSRLIAVVNDTLFSEARFTCVSRCRRFGKSMAAKMPCKSRELFADLLLVGINYDKETKTHSCIIERWNGGE